MLTKLQKNAYVNTNMHNIHAFIFMKTVCLPTKLIWGEITVIVSYHLGSMYS